MIKHFAYERITVSWTEEKERMARQIEDRLSVSLREDCSGGFSIGNTMVSKERDGVIRVYLHGNLIAHRTHPPKQDPRDYPMGPAFLGPRAFVENMTVERWEMSMCGWPTDTTRRRLNVVCKEVMRRSPWLQRDGLQYFSANREGVRGTPIPILSDTMVVLHVMKKGEDTPHVFVEIEGSIV